MSSSVQSINTTKTGGCPHGLAPGACPICSGMGGGGLRAGERVQKPGEMSYHECAMIGAMMRAREAQQKLHEQNLRLNAEILKEFQQKLLTMTDKMADIVNKMQNNVLLKPVTVIINNVVIPIIKIVINVLNVVASLRDKIIQIKEQFINIMDKLNAIFGEMKVFIEKKISEFVSIIKTKIKNVFKIFARSNANEDETKVDEDKKIFRLKNFIKKIRERKKDDSKDKSGS